MSSPAAVRQPRAAWLRTSSVLAALAFPLLAPRGAIADAEAWSIVHGDVRVLCPMTVGGSFQARTDAIQGTVTLEPPAAALGGDLSVALDTLDTGIGLRNEHLRRKYLEVQRGPGFDHAVLSGISLGDGDPRSLRGKARFTGTLLLHGTKRPVAGEATVRRDGDTVRVEATFPVTVSEFGIEKPQYLGVGVKDQVSVTVSLEARPSAGTEGTR